MSQSDNYFNCFFFFLSHVEVLDVKVFRMSRQRWSTMAEL